MRAKMSERARPLAGTVLALALFMAPGLSLGRDLAPYPSPVEVVAEVRGLAEEHPDRAEVFVIGESAGGREMLCVRVHAGDGEDRPAALVAGAIHGDEYIANRAAQAAADMLLDEFEPLADQVLQRMDIYIIPLINPDGYRETWDSEGFGDTKITRTNHNGVDLNRNFGKPPKRVDLPMGFSGHTDPGSNRWVGPFPASEPESRAVLELAREKRFFAAVDFHSAAGMIIPMLCDRRLDQRGLRKMALAYRKAQADKYSIAMFPYWLPIYQGSMEEGMHRVAGTLPILIELGKSRDMDRELGKDNHFWSFNPASEEVIDRVAGDNARAALHALIAAHDYTGGETEPRPAEVE